MKDNTISLKFFSDPGHGWLRVPADLLEDWGLRLKISPYSYVKGKSVYLEEDSDASIFLQEAKRRGVEVQVRSSSVNNRSTIRNYDSYDGTHLNYVPKVGDILAQYEYAEKDHNGFRDIIITSTFKVDAVNPRGVFLSGDGFDFFGTMSFEGVKKNMLSPEGIRLNAKRKKSYQDLCKVISDIHKLGFLLLDFDIHKDRFEVFLTSKGRHKAILKGAISRLPDFLISFTSSNIPFVPYDDSFQSVLTNPDEFVASQRG